MERFHCVQKAYLEIFQLEFKTVSLRYSLSPVYSRTEVWFAKIGDGTFVVKRKPLQQKKNRRLRKVTARKV